LTFGNLLTLPVGGGLLYVQPTYTQRQGSGGGAKLEGAAALQLSRRFHGSALPERP
jgi:uncharacterized membrane protein (UPF0182 family)